VKLRWYCLNAVAQAVLFDPQISNVHPAKKLKMNDLLKQVSAHIEFFGYSVQYEQGVLKAQHPSKPSFSVHTLAGGVLFRALFTLGSGAADNRGELQEFLDRANGITIVSKYHTLDQTMAIDAWYPASYTKASFGTFFEQYLADMQGPGAALLPLADKLFS
jgi:hypothetical protein